MSNAKKSLSPVTIISTSPSIAEANIGKSFTSLISGKLPSSIFLGVYTNSNENLDKNFSKIRHLSLNFLWNTI